MAAILPLLLLTFAAQGSPAAPECPTLLDGLRQKIVANYAGHLLEVKGARATRYHAVVRELGRDAIGADREACRAVLQRLIDWYDDPHLFLFQSTRLDSAETAHRVATLAYRKISERETLRAIAARSSVDPIEGVWYDGARRMAVVPGDTAGTFVAIVTASDTATLPVGVVVARITLTAPGVYRVRHLANSLAERVVAATMHREGTLLRLSPGMWGKAAPHTSAALRVLDTTDVHRPTIRVLPEMVIVSVPSHDPRFRPVLDSLVRANAAALGRSTPLLVDLRGNEGGGSQTTASLMPFLMDSNPRPRAHEFGDVVMLASPDQMRYAERSFGPDTSRFVRRLVAAMETHPGELVSLFDPAETPSPAPDLAPIFGPRQVAVLIDRGTVSASEVTVREAQRGQRAVVIGQPTAGALDYQSTFIVSFAEGERQWFLGYPTITAHPSLPAGGMRGKGIAPDVTVDWRGVEEPYRRALAILQSAERNDDRE